MSKVIKDAQTNTSFKPKKLGHNAKTKGWRLGPNTPGGSGREDKWIDASASTFTKVTGTNYVICTWTESPTGSGQGTWNCGICPGATAPPNPGDPGEDMPEGLQIIIECP